MTSKSNSKKPSELLSLYGQKLNQGLENKLSPFAFSLNFQYQSPHVAHISGYVLFRQGWILEFNEVITQEKTAVVRSRYRYHVMDSNKQLILRYDNVPHFPKIKTHPHHKHTVNEVVESQSPTLIEVIEEIENLQIKSI